MNKKSPSPQQRLLKLQKKIYRGLQDEADRLLGDPPEAIRKYEREYRRDFSSGRSLKEVPKVELIEAIRASDVTFVADYHTFDQAQRSALRLIRDAFRSGERWLIGLEMIPSHCQVALDEFQAGRLSLEAFHRAIRYREEWGFPWRNYAPLFDWAREHGVRLIALNRPKALGRSASASLRRVKKDSDLLERDQWAAGIITDCFSPRENGAPLPGEGPLRMLVLYGELHLAKSHLPKQLEAISRGFLKKSLRWLCIHQNDDRLYWNLAGRVSERSANIVQLTKNAYCVFSATPWAKLHSLISWAEGEHFIDSGARATTSGADLTIWNESDPSSAAAARVHSARYQDEDDEIEGESGGIDYLAAIKTYGEALAEFLEIPAPGYESLSVRTIDDADFVHSLPRHGEFSSREIQIIRRHVLENRRLYIPGAGIAYLAGPSPNGAAELAAIHLLRARARTVAIFRPEPDDFFRLVIESAFGFFGSLVINPHRKTDLPADHRRRVRVLENALKRARGPARAAIAREVSARKLAVALANTWDSEGPANLSPKLATQVEDLMRSIDGPSVGFESARFLGQMLGARLYPSLMAGQTNIETVKRLCLARSEGDHRPYFVRYTDLVVAASPAVIPPSKSEVI